MGIIKQHRAAQNIAESEVQKWKPWEVTYQQILQVIREVWNGIVVELQKVYGEQMMMWYHA